MLTCDWNKYDENVLATGSVDTLIKVWDVRNPMSPLETLHGHQYAVRRLRFSPHSESVLASCSYDMSVAVWNLDSDQNPLMRRYADHSEFVVGLDFNLFDEDKLLSCGWDENVFLWKV